MKESKIKKSRWLILILIIPLISIVLIIKFRHEYIPSNEEIIQEVKETKGYKAKVNYVFINQKKQYSEDAIIYYEEDNCNKIHLENGMEEIYKEEHIEIEEGQNNYKINEKLDTTYSLAFIEKIMKNKVLNINEGSEEWGEIEYLNIEVSLSSNNKHINKANVFINKKTRMPILIRVFDENNKLRIIINFKEFQYLNEIEKNKV